MTDGVWWMTPWRFNLINDHQHVLYLSQGVCVNLDNKSYNVLTSVSYNYMYVTYVARKFLFCQHNTVFIYSICIPFLCSIN